MILPTRRWRVFYFQETSMPSNFERSQLTKIMISSAPVKQKPWILPAILA